MIAETILFELLECGITPSVTPDGNGIEVEAGLLNAALQQLKKDGFCDHQNCSF